MPNCIYDYLKKWQGWAPQDCVSQAKFARDVANEFDIPLKDAEEYIRKFADLSQGAFDGTDQNV